MEATACVSPQIIDLVPRFLSNRRQDVERLHTALREEDFSALQERSEQMCALGRPYGFEPITKLGYQLREACAQRNLAMAAEVIYRYEFYLSRLWIEVAPEPVSTSESGSPGRA